MHHPSADRPNTRAAQLGTGLSELCKAVDHLREALYLLPDDSPLTADVGALLRQLRAYVTVASGGRVQP